MLRSKLDTFLILLEIGARNLLARRWKSMIIGGIIGASALVILVGGTIVDNVELGMQRSITDSISGHIQVFSADSKSSLQVLGGANEDLAPLEDYAKVSKVLLGVPNVAAVAPMGLAGALISSSNAMDKSLDNLRDSLSQHHQAELQNAKEYQQKKQELRRSVATLAAQLEAANTITEQAIDSESGKAIVKASSEEFWKTFDSSPSESLDFLETAISPLAADPDIVPVRLMGTNPEVYAKAFERMRIVDGERIPSGKRGFLLSKTVYEGLVKYKTVRGVDAIKRAKDERQVKLLDEPELRRVVDDNVASANELTAPLGESQLVSLREKLQRNLHSGETDVNRLLMAFFAMDDANFDARYKFLYSDLASDLRLYQIAVGDTVAVKVVAKEGFSRTANVKLYGTYAFKGLEKSDLAGAISMIDLVSFRELYGYSTSEHESEMATLHAAIGAADLDRRNVEANLFRSDSEEMVDVSGVSANQEDLEYARLRGTRAKAEKHQLESYDPKDLSRGQVHSVAVVVKDERKIAATIRAVEAAVKQSGLNVKVISWREATAKLGQFINMMKGVLNAAVLIILAVALIIMNNALVMATLERVSEIGTLRAIGAPRMFVVWMLVVESLFIGLVGGGGGLVLGGLILILLGHVGIPATNEVLSFFFSGPRLYPMITPKYIAVVLLVVVVLGVVTTLYPAVIAMRMTPRQAMSSEA